MLSAIERTARELLEVLLSTTCNQGAVQNVLLTGRRLCTQKSMCKDLRQCDPELQSYRKALVVQELGGESLPLLEYSMQAGARHAV